MEKLNYCRKKCQCGRELKVDGTINANEKLIIIRCNNPNCLKKYYMNLKTYKKCENKYHINPQVM